MGSTGNLKPFKKREVKGINSNVKTVVKRRDSYDYLIISRLISLQKRYHVGKYVLMPATSKRHNNAFSVRITQRRYNLTIFLCPLLKKGWVNIVRLIRL